jgi:hypothetical protein
MNKDGSGAPMPSKEDNALMDRLKSENRVHAVEQKSTSRTLHVVVRLVQVGTAAVIALLLMVWFIDHPALSSSTKTPVIGVLFVICVAYIVALELARGRAKVVIFLVVSATAACSFSGGYATCWLHHHM